MKRLRILFLSIAIVLAFSFNVKAEFFSDIIVSGPNGIWTDSRAYSSLNAAITAVGSNQRTVKVVSPQTVTVLTVPANVTLEFERDGSITNSDQLTINTKNIVAENRQIFTGVGNIDFASGTVVKSGWFSNFETALALTGNDTVVLQVTKPQTLTASFALGNNVSLEWEAPGNILTVNAGINITNIGQITAGNYQILAGAGNFRFRDGTNLNLTWFPHLRAAITWVNTNTATLVIHGSNTVDYTDSVPTNISLDFRSHQGILSISAGITLTIPNASQIDAKTLSGCIDQAIFTGLGTASYAGPFCADPSAVDQGATTNSRSIASLLASIGTSKQATIVLAHSGSGNTTTYTVTTPINWASYPLVKMEVEKGAVISGTITALVQEVYPEWWGITGTNDYIAIQSALDSITSGTVKALAATYSLGATGVTIAASKGIVGAGKGATVFSYSGTGYAVTLGDNVAAIAYGTSFKDVKVVLTNKAGKAIRLLATVGGDVDATTQGVMDATSTNVGVTIDGGNFDSFFNTINVQNQHMNKGFKITTSGTAKPTTQFFVNPTSFGDLSYYPANGSIGFDFDADCGSGSVILGGNLEWNVKGINIAQSGATITVLGTRFESNTTDIVLGLYTVGSRFIGLLNLDNVIDNSGADYGWHQFIGCTKSTNEPYPNTMTKSEFVSSKADFIPIISRGYVAQAANLQEWQSYTTSVLASVNSVGQFSYVPFSATAANLSSSTNAINTTGKYTGKAVWVSDAIKYVYASGAGATDHWYNAVGADTYTPVP